MNKKEKLVDILTEDMDDEVLSKMPEWFKILKENYTKRENQIL